MATENMAEGRRKLNGYGATISSTLQLFLLLSQCFLVADALFGNKKRKQREAELLAKQLAEEATRRQRMYILAGCVAAVIGIGTLVLFADKLGISLPWKPKKKKGNRPGAKGTVDVVVVGCGLPKKSMVSPVQNTYLPFSLT